MWRLRLSLRGNGGAASLAAAVKAAKTPRQQQQHVHRAAAAAASCCMARQSSAAVMVRIVCSSQSLAARCFGSSSTSRPSNEAAAAATAGTDSGAKEGAARGERLKKQAAEAMEAMMQRVADSVPKRPSFASLAERGIKAEAPHPLELPPELAALAQESSHALSTHTLGTQLLEYLATVPADDLNRLLTCYVGSRAFVERLLKRARRPKLRLPVLELLTHRRVNDLSLLSKAALIRGLQQEARKLRLTVPDMRGIANIFLSTHGVDLSKLKTAVNVGTGHYDLQRLIFRDIANLEIRYDLLQHFAIQAANCQHMEHALQIMTDYDDTVQLNWLDKRYPRKTVYPGVIPFLEEMRCVAVPAAASVQQVRGLYEIETLVDTAIAEAPPSSPAPSAAPPATFAGSGSADPELAAAAAASADGAAQTEQEEEDALNDAAMNRVVPAAELCAEDGAPDSHGGVIVLTARPTGVRSMVKRRTHKHLQWLQWGNLTVLSGSVLKVASTDAIVAKKFQNFQQYKSLFPEHSFIIVGDSGQGDAAFASLVARYYPLKVKGVFIHDVRPGDKTGDGGLKATYAAQGINFFQSYIGAAVAAVAADLLKPAGLARIALAAVDEFMALPFKSGSKWTARWLAARQTLLDDIQAALPLLLPADALLLQSQSELLAEMQAPTKEDTKGKAKAGVSEEADA